MLKKRDRARQLREKEHGVQMANFVVGDFVLYQDVWAHRREKLRTKWCGPAEITKVTSHWLYEIRNLVTGDVREVHASRLKVYADSELNITSGLLAHLAHNSEGYEVEKIVAARYNVELRSFEVLIKWRGLVEVENTWEPADIISEDVPALFMAFCNANSSAIVKNMKKAYEENSS
ncbi:hypothetical protein Ae201684_004904 [Aphanomyces euteiches]|uniref:Chromo domain-containing protein n=1 Tax=Aphanomyces euteiches TaxID=100861 RepID=A0A6G0XGJ0_9STRA|nr:hypothetical protein Ae201684_004904 [Aphanomyces euteiches]